VNPTLAEAAKRALAKALPLYWDCTPVWDFDRKAWRVVSNSHPDVIYFVTRHPTPAPGTPWWEKLSCTCPAGQAGFRVCYHMALVKLWWEHKHDTEVERRERAQARLVLFPDRRA
jgi:hypothetical protein